MCNILENFLTWDLSDLILTGRPVDEPALWVNNPLLMTSQRCFVNCNQQVNYKNKTQQPKYDYGMENN